MAIAAKAQKRIMKTEPAQGEILETKGVRRALQGTFDTNERAARAAKRDLELVRRARSIEKQLRTRGKQNKALEQVIDQAIHSRVRRELAELDVRRSIIHLGEQNVPQRAIADLVGLSQAEISRRLKRRELTPLEPSPRELILRREVGELSTKNMMTALLSMKLTSTPPGSNASFDGGATSTGSAKQLAMSYQEGLLKRTEYEQLRKSIHTVPEPRLA